MIRCLIFDCDGTLVDSEYLCNLGLAIKLQEYDINEQPIELMRCFRGWKLANIIQQLEFKHCRKFDSDFVSTYRIIVSNLFKTELKPVAGIEQALSNIDLPKCVASSAPIQKIEEALKVTNLSKYFSRSIFSSYNINSWKPEPDIFLHAAKNMGYAPENCAVIEDSHLGIEAALAAKMTAIFYNPNSEPVNHKGVSSLVSMYQLTEMVKELRSSYKLFT